MTIGLSTGKSAFLQILKEEGIEYLFGNPGTTELPIMSALADHPDLHYVLGMHESVVLAMADGFSRSSGKLVACNVHVTPGLGNAMGSLYNAWFTGTPMILTAGQLEQGYGLMEPLLHGPMLEMARPVVKWAVEVTRLEDLPRILRRAAKVATTPPTGPVFIALPGDILNAEGMLDLGHPTRIDTRVRPSAQALAELASRILQAENPVLVCGDEVVKSDALEEVAKLAEILGCPSYQSSAPYGAHFLSGHPCYMGGMSRLQAEAHSILLQHDLLIAIGGDVMRMMVYTGAEAMPESMQIVQVGLSDWEIGKNYPTSIGIKADVRETLRELNPVLQELGGKALQERARQSLEQLQTNNWTARRESLVRTTTETADSGTISSDFLCMTVADCIPEDGIVIQEGLTTTVNLTRFYPFLDRYSYHGLASGGIGWGLPAAVGAQLANPDRPVTAVIGDGSAMYSVQALWTAAHKNLPITFVICNNSGYKILKQRLVTMQQSDRFIGMDLDNPEINWERLTTSLGVGFTRVSEAQDLFPVLNERCRRRDGGPTLVEVILEKNP
ncbi:thiamine pyrophosphate-binding protein [Haliea sp. E17]|uniref:thiamine pyrophosphate-binding protein n=1 Tax=Haliea sp. E17 TaxID=3401576 RepID=UPI003AAC9E08